MDEEGPICHAAPPCPSIFGLRVEEIDTINDMVYTLSHGGRSQVVRRWTVTPLLAGSNPVVRPVCLVPGSLPV